MFLFRDGIDRAGDGGNGVMRTFWTETDEGIQVTLQLKHFAEAERIKTVVR